MMFPDVKRSTDLRRRLSLDAALAWQVFSLAHAAEPLAAVRFIPKAGAMERFTLAARKAGATPAVCAAVAQAFTEYEALVRVHAGDRDTFAAMLSAHQPAEGATWLKLRKAAFRANRGIWGISLECSANAVVFNQRPTGEMDALAVRGRLGANGFRAGVSVAMSISMRVWGGNSPAPEGRIPENDPSKVVTSGGGLIERACSQPLPKVESRACPDGTFRDFVTLDGLGRRSKATVWWTSFGANFPGSRNPPHGCSSPCPEPTEIQIVDLLIPHGWGDPARLRCRAVGPDVRFTPGVGGSLPNEGAVAHLGQRLESLYTPNAPAHVGLVTDEIRRLGWQTTTFEIFRCIVKYPVLHSTTHLYVD